MTDIVIRSAELESEVKGNTLAGYASVFGTYADLGSYVETFAPTAFDATLSDPATDVRAYYQHDSKMLLGRQKSGTLRIWTDTKGLGFELDLPENVTYANDVRALAERGDLGGMSIGFRPNPAGETTGRLGQRHLRTHTSIASLIEISPVSIPAYADTTVSLRSIDSIAQPVIDDWTQQFLARMADRSNRKESLH